MGGGVCGEGGIGRGRFSGEGKYPPGTLAGSRELGSDATAGKIPRLDGKVGGPLTAISVLATSAQREASWSGGPHSPSGEMLCRAHLELPQSGGGGQQVSGHPSRQTPGRLPGSSPTLTVPGCACLRAPAQSGPAPFLMCKEFPEQLPPPQLEPFCRWIVPGEMWTWAGVPGPGSRVPGPPARAGLPLQRR